MVSFARLVVSAIPALLAGSLCAQAPTFTDDFEGTSLNSFWTPTSQSGFFTFPCTTVVHGGAQSVQFDSTMQSGVNKGMQLTHVFPAPTYGDVSVWAYDSGAGQSSSNYISLFANSGSQQVSVFTFDYSLSSTNGGSYTYNAPGQATAHSTVARTLGWHQFRIITTATSLTLMVDTTVVYSGPGGYPIDNVALYMGGPSWRPAWTCQFDDFAFLGGPSVLASLTPFGQGCPGPNGTPQLLAVGGSRPIIGQTLHLQVANLPTATFSVPFAAVGFSNQAYGSTQLPLALDFLGAPGCVLFTSIDQQFALTNTGGTALWDIAVPYNVSILGLDAYLQAAAYTAGVNAAGFVVANALHAFVGSL